MTGVVNYEPFVWFILVMQSHYVTFCYDHEYPQPIQSRVPWRKLPGHFLRHLHRIFNKHSLVCFVILVRSLLPAELSIPALESRIEKARAGPSSQDDLNELSHSLAKLSKDLADASGSLPSYDQKQYELVRFQFLVRSE